MHYLKEARLTDLQPVYPSSAAARYLGLSERLNSKARRSRYHACPRTLEFYLAHEDDAKSEAIMARIAAMLAAEEQAPARSG